MMHRDRSYSSIVRIPEDGDLDTLRQAHLSTGVLLVAMVGAVDIIATVLWLINF
jgi:hypothetical protein